MKKKFTISEMNEGDLAVRGMSKKAQEAHSGTDLLNVAKYIDMDATQEAEDKAWEEERDFFPGELNVIRYAIIHDGDVIPDLSFEEAEKWLEDYFDALEEY